MKKTRKKKGKGKMEGIVKKMWERGKKYKKKEGKNREFIFYLLVLAHTDHSRTLFWKKYDSFSFQWKRGIVKEKKKKLKKEGIYFYSTFGSHKKIKQNFFGKRYHKKGGGGEKMLGFELIYTHESVWTVELHV